MRHIVGKRGANRLWAGALLALQPQANVLQRSLRLERVEGHGVPWQSGVHHLGSAGRDSRQTRTVLERGNRRLSPHRESSGSGCLVAPKERPSGASGAQDANVLVQLLHLVDDAVGGRLQEEEAGERWR